MFFLSDGHGPNYNLNNLSYNYHSLNAFSGHLIPKAMMNSTGWVCNEDGLLFWVPEDCRPGLTSPAIMTIPNTIHTRCVRFDFTHFKCGTSWTKVHRMN